jgi:hypothetical protein
VPQRSTRGRDPSPSAKAEHSEKRLPSPSAMVRHSGKKQASPSARGRNFPYGAVRLRRQIQLFFYVCISSPSVALGEDGLPRVASFPKCLSLFGTRESLSSPSAILPRVQLSGKSGFPECPIFGTRGSIWHSGNFTCPIVCGWYLGGAASGALESDEPHV